jgi:PAS domain S-box-containing protein
MPDDFTLSMRIAPGDTYEWSRVLLARAYFDGKLELLTAAWERFLGYGRRELLGKTLRHVLWTDERARAAVAAILDQRNMAPVDILLRCRDGREKALRLHRRYDPYERSMFIVAEESPGS